MLFDLDSKKTDQNFCFFLKPRQIAGVEQVLSRCRAYLLRAIESYQRAIEEVGAFSIDPPGIEKLSRLQYEKA